MTLGMRVAGNPDPEFTRLTTFTLPNVEQHEALQKHVEAVQSIIDDDQIVSFPYIESAAVCGLAILRSFEYINIENGNATVVQQFMEIAHVLVELLKILLKTAKRCRDGVEQVPSYLSMCKEVLIDLQTIVSDISGLGVQDPNWITFCVECPSIYTLLCRHKRKAIETNKSLFLASRRLVQDLRQKPPTGPPTIPLPAAPSTLADLTGCVTPLGSNSYPVAYGGFADIWVGQWNSPSGRCKVAIKVIRFHSDDPKSRSKQNKRLLRELFIWQRLKHSHVLELYGTTNDFGPPSSVGMVCLWAEQGNLSSYLNRYHKSMKLSERYRILIEVATGLSYLHNNSVIHGDLTGSNVLLDTSANVFISDFGLSSIMAEIQETSSNSAVTGAVRWTAPELFRIPAEGDSATRPSVRSDIFSYGRIMLQTLSGKVPYDYLRTDGQVFFELYKKLHPRRPFIPWITDVQWDYMLRCWAEKPEERPGLQEIQDFIRHYYDILVSSLNTNEL